MKLDCTSLQIDDVLVMKDQICFIVADGHSFALWIFNVDLNSMNPLFHWLKRASFCTVVVDTVLYVIGGRRLVDGYNVYFRNAFSHSSTFDTEGNEWKEIAPLKEARRDAFAVSKNDEKVFIAGGLGVFDDWLTSCEVYNIATNEWQFIASLTVPRAFGKMVLIDETIYVLGGRVKKPFQNPCPFPDGKVVVECYDEETDKWNDKTTIPIHKITLRRMSQFGYYEVCLNICSLRLFKGVEFNNLYPIRF